MVRIPDAIFLVVATGVTVAIVVCLGQPVWHKDGWQAFSLRAIPLSYTIIMAAWWAPWPHLRLRAYRLFYKYFGPQGTATVWAQFRVDAHRSDSDLLGEVHRLARESWGGADKESGSRDQAVVSWREQTLSARVVTRNLSEHDPAEPEPEEDEGEVEKWVHVRLWGYRGRISRIDSMLDRNARPLLNGLLREVKKQRTYPQLSVEVQLDNTNPFLALYLRDMPSGHLAGFHLQVQYAAASEEGPVETVDVTINSVSVTARSPDALVEAARRYLASPNLSHRREFRLRAPSDRRGQVIQQP